MKKHCLTLFTLVLIALSAYSQSDSARLSGMITKLEKLSSSNPIEKVYLHLNKPNYNIGDTIWFKSYLTVSERHLPSALSGILYVELINDKDKIIHTLRLKNTNGVAAGDIILGDNITPGNYRIRAYTNWMRNSGPDYFFVKNVSIDDLKTSSIFVTASIEAGTKSREDPVNAKLNYADKFGRPFDHKQVSYEIKADTNIIYKGNGITDDQGNLNITFSDKAAGGKTSLTISNHIQLSNSLIVDKKIPLSLQHDNIDIQFFPEGGQLVNGVRSKVAFKAIGTNGLGTDIKGVIVDNDNKEVAYFSSQHAGMGIFALMSQSGKTYTAKITQANHTTTAKLPMATDKGFVLAINSSDSLNLNIRIATNSATLAEMKGQAFYLVGQANGSAHFTTFGKLDEPTFAISIPKSKFPSGIAQFTLFNANNEPLNERIVFIYNKADLLNLDLKSEKTIYAGKERVNLLFNANDNTGKPALGSFSLSVFNEDRLTANENAEGSILGNILLTSDLKGYIEEPNYYFNQATDQAKADLDVLMLTQGYRQFEWRDLMNDKYPQINFQPEKTLNISGTLTNASGKPMAKGKLKVLALAEKTVIDTITDAEGKFNLEDVEFPDSTKLVIQARKANDGRNVNISLDNQHTVPVVFKSNVAEVAKSAIPPYLSMRAQGDADTTQIVAAIKAETDINGKQLKEVKIIGKKETAPNKYNKYGTAYQFNLKMEQATNYNSVYEAIQYRVPGVTYQNGGLIFERRIPIVLVVVNGLEHNIRYAEILDPKDMEDISYVAGGPIILTTKAYVGTDTVKISNDNAVTNNNKMLKEVKIKGIKSNGTANAPWMSTVTHSANINGPGHADFIYSSKDLLNCVDLVTCIINKLPGIVRNGGNYYFSRHMAQSITAPPPIKFMLDGLILDNSTPLDALNAIDVQSVEVLNSSVLLSAYGSQASGGLIIITTKIGSGDESALAFKSVPGIIYTKFNGFYKTRQFYTPKYTTNMNLPDRRTAVYWNPNIITNGNDSVPIIYFNSDIKGSYKAVVEGIDNDGNIGRYVYRYRVE